MCLIYLTNQITQDKEETMSNGSQRLLERKKVKGPRVLELFNQGHSYREIAKLVHMSLRDVSKFINLAEDRTGTPSIHDLIIQEYRVSSYRHELRDLRLQKDHLTTEVSADHLDIINKIRRLEAGLNYSSR